MEELLKVFHVTWLKKTVVATQVFGWVSPRKFAEMIQFDVRIFFKWIETRNHQLEKVERTPPEINKALLSAD